MSETSMSGKSLFCFGLGYCAGALAELARNQGWQVAGTRREMAGDKTGTDADIPVLPFDGSSAPEPVGDALAAASHILISIPPGRDGDPVLAHFADKIAARADGLDWIGYLSTVGVYGDHDGAWIDETAPCHPVSERGRRRLAAEQAWQALAEKAGIPLAIFRLPGIYGPGRNQLAKLRQGETRRIVKPGQVFNRAHVADIAQTLLRSMAAPPETVRVYNVCDDEPAPPQDVITFAGTLLGRDLPDPVAFDAAELSPMARSFYGENKRCRNGRIKTELGVELAFPTYREGLTAIFAAGAY